MKQKKAPFKLSWEAHAYEYKERSQDWFWAVSIITVAIAVTSIIFGNIIFAILVVVAAFSLLLFINREPETIEIVVDEKGVSKDGLLYPYEALHSFHIDIEHSHPKILLRSHKSFIPLILVPLGEADAEEVHEILSQFLKEEIHSLPFVEKVLEFLGF